MKKSKSLFTRICQSFLKRFFTNTLFPYFLRRVKKGQVTKTINDKWAGLSQKVMSPAVPGGWGHNNLNGA